MENSTSELTAITGNLKKFVAPFKGLTGIAPQGESRSPAFVRNCFVRSCGSGRFNLF